MNAVILCGGKATRLGALTAATPKSLLEVAGRPFLAHQLEILDAQGFGGEVILCVSHLAEKILAAAPGRRYFVDFPARGTGGAVARILDLVSDPFLVMNGDAYPGWDLRSGVIHYDRTWEGMTWAVKRPGNLDIAMGVAIAYEKGAKTLPYTDTGIGIFSKKAFNFVKPEVFDFSDVYRFLMTRYHLGVEVVDESRFYEIGSMAGLERARRNLK